MTNALSILELNLKCQKDVKINTETSKDQEESDTGHFLGRLVLDVVDSDPVHPREDALEDVVDVAGPEVDLQEEEVETEEADLAVKLSTISQPTENTAPQKRQNGQLK